MILFTNEQKIDHVLLHSSTQLLKESKSQGRMVVNVKQLVKQAGRCEVAGEAGWSL